MDNFGEKFKGIANQIGGFAEAVEKFVEDNIIEKEQREQNIRRLGKTIDGFVSEKIRGNSLEPQKLMFRKLPHFTGEIPRYESAGASGMDVKAQIPADLIVDHGERVLVPTGLSFEIPRGYEIQVRPRSGWALREGLSVLNTPGTIDSDYRGELKVLLINLGNKPVKIQNHERIAQLVLCPIAFAEMHEVVDLSDTERGAGGFGSTGGLNS